MLSKQCYLPCYGVAALVHFGERRRLLEPATPNREPRGALSVPRGFRFPSDEFSQKGSGGAIMPRVSRP